MRVSHGTSGRGNSGGGCRMMLGGGTWWAGDRVGDKYCGCGRGCG